ncbi:MAG: uroporphyrinogen-III synthase [Magnetococcales bacterium]|nr:uroporphyrinogen-III synthase [Magnetococcales bacterium]MBF0157407.1 uroporphyrinogen-III synthase [Magnetococcales bacterium]
MSREELTSLAGRHLLITRPEPEALATARMVEAVGGVAHVAPALLLAPPLDPAPLREAVGRCDRFDGVILTSANGARAFLRALPPGLSPAPIFAVGPKSAAVLTGAGLPVATPEQAGDAEVLARYLLERFGRDRHYLFLRAGEGRETLVGILTAEGVSVTLVEAYRMVAATTLDTGIRARLERGEMDAVTFFSARSAEAFLALLGPDRHRWWSPSIRVAALSPAIARGLMLHGFEGVVTAPVPAAESLLAALAATWRQALPG